MGRRSASGGVIPKGDRIQFDITYQGKRLRPTIDMKPTQANLAYARRRHADIVQRIRNGVFDFAAEFPDYKFIDKVAPSTSKTFGDVVDDWLLSIGDLAFATRDGYRKIANNFWKPLLGARDIKGIRYSELAKIIGGHPWGSLKTRNNVLSVLCRVFEFAHADELIERDPTERLKSAKVQRQPPDPFSLQEAEAIIAGILKDWGQDDADYFEWQFFVGTRPSEAIALDWPSCDRTKGIVRIDKARVMGRDKDRTKTAVVRDIELNPRAHAVLTRRWARTGLKGKNVFGYESGDPYGGTQVQLKRWAFTLKRLGIRYREAYQCRHTSVSWCLMIGENLLRVAEQHGHSPAVMLKTYAKWLKGATPEDIEAIRRAMGYEKAAKRKPA